MIRKNKEDLDARVREFVDYFEDVDETEEAKEMSRKDLAEEYDLNEEQINELYDYLHPELAEEDEREDYVVTDVTDEEGEVIAETEPTHEPTEEDEREDYVVTDVTDEEEEVVAETEPTPEETEAGALLVACVDSRFFEKTFEFAKNKFSQITTLIVPGGIGALTLELMPKPAEALRRQIKFILKETGIKKVVLVSHDDCKWYHLNQGYFTNPQPEQQKLDLQSAKSILEERFEGVEVLCYHAEIKDNRIEFSSLND